MATYSIDPTNWNSAAFWNSISETAAPHTLDFSLLGDTFSVDVTSTPGLVSITDGTTSFTIGEAGFGGASDATLGGTTSWSFFTSLIGGDGDDTLNGTAGDDTIFGNNGGDFIRGGAGDDRIFGEDGDDTFAFVDGYGNDTITGGMGLEDAGDSLDMGAITTDLTVDLTDARIGYGTATGVDGTIRFSEVERIVLSSGTDTIVLGNGSGDDIVVNFKPPVDNGDGTFTGVDLFDVTGVTGAGGPLTAGDVTVTDTNGDGTGDAILTFPGGENITLIGVTAAEVGGPDQLVAMGFPVAPDFIVEGTGGDDSIVAGTYTDDPEGDLIDANDNATGTNDDLVQAGAGSDTVEAGDGDDTILGEAGDDSLSGNDGADQINGGAGNDEMFGGADADRFVLTDGFGSDTVVGGETTTTGTDSDTLDLSGLSTGIDGTMNADEAGNIVNGGDNVQFSEIENIILTGSADQFSTAGDSLGVSVQGGGGEDTFIGDAGDDTLDGGDERDTFSYGAAMGNDSLVGGEGGDDTGDTVDISALGTAANVVFSGSEAGTIASGGDTTTFEEMEALVLTGLDDAVDASADGAGMVIDAGAGADNVLGGSGDDSIDGADGDDTIDGGAGNDTLNGGFGNDLVAGGDGDDELHGFEDNDTLQGGAGADTIEGGEGDDSILGEDGADSINGDLGNDSIDAGAGDDFLRGSFGNDTLHGGTGDDYVWGGFGDDLFLVENDFGNDTIEGEDQDEVLGDTLDLSGVTDALTVDLTEANPEIGTFSDGTSTAIFEEIETIILGGGVDTLVLADAGGSDIVNGFAAPTDNGDGTFAPGDLLDVRALTSDGGTTPVTTDDVTVTDTNGDGTGDAILTFPGGESLTLTGVSPDAVSAPAALEAMGIPGVGGPIVQNYIVEGTPGDDVIDTAYLGDPEGDQIDNLDNLTSDNNDSVQAGDGNDAIEAGSGDDTVDAGAGDDTLNGESGADILRGEGGDDTFVLEDGFDDDTISGGETGETAGDTLDLRAVTTGLTVDLRATDPEAGSFTNGTDTATFSEIETILMSGGNDTVQLGDGSGADVVSGFAAPVDTGAGFTTIDQLDVSGLTSDGGTTPVNTSDVTVTDTNGDGTGDAILTFPGGESITLSGVLPSAVTSLEQLVAIGIPADPSNFTVDGTPGGDLIDATYTGDPQGDQVDASDGPGGIDNDTILAGDGDDTVNAGVADDSVDGGAGDDALTGGAGDDTLSGGTGDDTLNSDPGSDVLLGGDDSDTFVVTDGTGTDTVTGGEGGTDLDTLDATGLSGVVTVNMTGPEAGSLTNGTDTVTFSEIESILLSPQNDTLDGSSDTVGFAANGGAGADSLTGGQGDDSLTGGDGNDTLFGALGADTLNGGSGNDVFRVGSNDSALGGDGDDVFNVGPADVTGGPLFIDGGETGEVLGDTLNITGPATIVMGGAEDGTVTWLNGSTLTFQNIETVTYTACFTTGTRITTPEGDIAVEHLSAGDRVVTRDGAPQAIRWIGSKGFTADALRAQPHLAPIHIPAGALGGGHPASDLILSPQHRVLVCSAEAELWFGDEEVLVTAQDLLVLDGVERIFPEDGIRYFHFLCDRHEIVRSNGAWTESFQPGDLSLGSLDGAQRAEIFTIFPELADEQGREGYAAARVALKSHQARVLLGV